MLFPGRLVSHYRLCHKIGEIPLDRLQEVTYPSKSKPDEAQSERIQHKNDTLTTLKFPWGSVSPERFRGRELAYLSWFQRLPPSFKKDHTLSQLIGRGGRPYRYQCRLHKYNARGVSHPALDTTQ